MNHHKIQIIVGILLILVYLYCTRNKEGYRGGVTCQTRPVIGSKIYARVRPFKRCRKGLQRGFRSELKRVMTPIPRGRVPVNKGEKILSRRNARTSGPALKDFMNRATYEGAKKGANYMEKFQLKLGKNTTTKVDFYKGASIATKSTAESQAMKNNMKASFILPPGSGGRAGRAGSRRRAGRAGSRPRGGISRFIQRCRRMFRRRNIPVGASPQMRNKRDSLTPEQWARDDRP